jgi:hypothetical protein
MALFGGSEKRKERSDAVEAELGRLAALPLSELALETMTKGFAGSDGYLSVTEVSGALMAAADCDGLSQEHHCGSTAWSSKARRSSSTPV